MEKLLQVSPSLAQTLGLEEALLVQLLHEMQIMQASTHVSISDEQRLTLLPFWSRTQFGNLLNRLQAQGVVQYQGQGPWVVQCQVPEDRPNEIQGHQVEILAAQPNQAKPTTSVESPVPPPAPQAEAVPVYAMNEARLRNQYEDDLAYLKPETKTATPRARRSKMHAEWEPSADFPQLLSFHDIPLQFALSELAKFRQYYLSTDRTEISWDVRYLNWVQRAWADSLNAKGRNDRQQATNGESADTSRAKRSKVRDALRNIQDTDW